MATRQPERAKALVLVSATPYFPEPARTVMGQYAEILTEQQRDVLRQRHPGGDEQINALLDSTKAFADSCDDLNFTAAQLSEIQARTLIVQGDHDPLYLVEISVEMASAIPRSTLWMIPGAGHGPIIGERWPEFQRRATAFLQE